MSTLDTAGPLLSEIFDAQLEDERAVSYPRLVALAGALAEYCAELDNPLVWPVGAAAERLAGAALALTRGGVRLRGWSTDVADERVLLVTVTAVTPLPLLQAAEQAQLLGAADVHALGVDVRGLSEMEPYPFKSYRRLGNRELSSRSVAGPLVDPLALAAPRR